MKPSSIRRIEDLERLMRNGGAVEFTTEGGGSFRPVGDPFEYLAENGRVTPDGAQIVGIKVQETEDSLSASLYGLLEAMASGSVPTLAEIAHEL